MPAVTPRTPAPPLSFDTVGGSRWDLADQSPEQFTMVVFYRGLHCPVCKTYLSDLVDKAADFRERGVEPVAVSGDDPDRAAEAASDWSLDGLTVGHSLPVDAMREWGLYISTARSDAEPAQFGEPGLFLVCPDRTLYYAAVNSMPFGRPVLGDMLDAVDFVTAKDYPPRGVA